MKLHVHVTYEDYVRFNIFHAFHSKTSKRAILLSRCIPAIVCCIWYVLDPPIGMPIGFWLRMIGLQAPFCIAYFLLYPKLHKWLIRRNVRKVKKEGKLPYHEDADLEFGDDTFIETTDHSATTIQYADILSINETADAIYLMHGAISAFIIPLRDLGDQKDALLALLREKCPHIAQ